MNQGKTRVDIGSGSAAGPSAFYSMEQAQVVGYAGLERALMP